MVNREIVFQKGTLYHIYNRGCNKKQLFFDERDYERFLSNIARFKAICSDISIPVWCLLPNHFHFLLGEKLDLSASDLDSYPRDTNPKMAKDTNPKISLFMQKLQQAYAAFFNTKYRGKIKKKKGPVFEGRFQAREIPNDEYLAHLKDYIEYNAVKHELVARPEDWKYSSFQSSGAKKFKWNDDFDPFFE